MPQSSNLSQVMKTMKSLQIVQAQESWEARENSSHLTDLNAKFEIFITAQLRRQKSCFKKAVIHAHMLQQKPQIWMIPNTTEW